MNIPVLNYFATAKVETESYIYGNFTEYLEYLNNLADRPYTLRIKPNYIFNLLSVI